MSNTAPPRLCSFCSLLCAPSDPRSDFGETFCSRRNRELEGLRSWYSSAATSTDAAVWEPEFRQAKAQLERSASVLVTGRIHDIETARGVVRIAKRCSATLDGWDSGAAFESILAVQRSGQYSVSLAEARSISTLILVIGDDSFLEDYPRMPMAISRGESVPVLLLGQWSDRGRKAWLDAGFQVLAVESDIERLPRALSQSAHAARAMEWESQAGDWLQQSRYTTVLFSMRHLNLRHGDLWYEAMMQWIATKNEESRCGALSWSGLEGSFQQVCTWLTGFPGRVRFMAGQVDYSPHRHIAGDWISQHDGVDRPVEASTILWVDDTSQDVPASVLESGLPVVVVASKRPRAIGPSVLWLPSQHAGIGSPGCFFRGDQAVLVQAHDPLEFGRKPLEFGRELPAAHDWLRRLCES